MPEKKKTFLQTVLEFMNGGEEANVANILKHAKKKWLKQISLKEKKIKSINNALQETLEDHNEYLDEAKEALLEAYKTIDGEIKGRDYAIDFINNTYEIGIASAMARIDAIEEQITSANHNAETEIKRLEKDIEFYKTNIKNIK